MPHYVYILYSEKLDRYYIGQTEDVELRLSFHNNPVEPRKFTAKGIPWVFKISMTCLSKAHAMRLEAFLKRMKSRQFIEKLILDEKLRDEILTKTAPDC